MKQVILITVSGHTEYNTSLINQIKKTSTTDVVLAWDKKGVKKIKENEFNIVNDCDELFKTYGDKVRNFNGRWKDNPAKLGAFHWFSQKNNIYDMMWVFEDDVYVKNCQEFIDSYSNQKTDIICKHSSQLPFWYPRFRVGDQTSISKDTNFVFAHLYVARYSKKASNCIINEIQNSKDTNHHELWIPYVACKYRLSYSNLLSQHLPGLRPNPTSNPRNSYSNISYDICHPYKHKLV